MKKYLLLLLATSSLTQAATFNVSTTPELRNALSVAATNGEDDIINLADGTYKTTDDGEGTFIFYSNERNSLTLLGSGSENVILSGDNTHQIYNHDSTVLSPLKLEKLSFVDANGGGVKTTYSIDVVDCNFSNNTAGNGAGFSVQNNYTSTVTVTNSTFADNIATGSGGGFYSLMNREAFISVTNSTFINNSAGTGKGGGIYSNSQMSVMSSTFTNNSAGTGGGGLYSAAAYKTVGINNTTFTNNSATGNGGGIYADAAIVLINSVFTNNSATDNGGGIYSAYNRMEASNLLLTSNSSGIYLRNPSSRGHEHKIINSVFLDNNIDISGNDTVVISRLNNNYINILNVTLDNFAVNNIFNDVILGFVEPSSGDYNLTSASDLIDAGTTAGGITLGATDLNGNDRISGGNIDIGPYEFSGTRPTINSVTYTGTAKEANELTFATDYTLADGRELTEVSYDFLNDGNYTSVNTYTYNAAGTYTVSVKVTDSNGEFSTTTTSVAIAELPFDEMTYEQKLIKAIPAEYYDALLAEIALEQANAATTATTAGIATGKQYVQDNPSEFSLVTETAFDANSDLDGDGYTNEDEVDFCSNPFDRQSVPKIGGLSPIILKAIIDAQP